MTGKELLLVFAGTTAFAGLGGVGAAVALRDQPSDDTVNQAILERLDRLDRSIQETNGSIEAGHEEIAGLRSRMRVVEGGLHQRPAATRPGRVTLPGRGAVDADVDAEGDADGVMDGASIDLDGVELSDEVRAKIQESMKAALEKLGSRIQTGGGSPQLGTIFASDGSDGAIRVLGDRLGSLSKSFALRRLPEEERWQKARDEVGLNDVQVQEIQSAIEARDTAIRESMIVDSEEGTGTSHFSVRRMDMAKTKEANTAYRSRVDDVLNDQQKKSWKDGGYDNAFGNSSMGSTTVISIGSTQTVESAEGPDSR